jgi:gliding motility-associated-like protein
MKGLFPCLFILMFFGYFNLSNAQNNVRISYKNAASVPDFLNVCGLPDTVVVTLRPEGISSSARTQFRGQLHLFKGIEFVEFLSAGSSSGVSLSNFDISKPTFSLPDLTAVGLGSQIDIRYVIRARCGYLDSISANNQALVFDSWEFSYNLGLQTNLIERDNNTEYRDAIAAAFFTLGNGNQDTLRRVGDCFSRTIRVANSSLDGIVDGLEYSNKQGASVTLTGLLVNGIPISFNKSAASLGDTIISAEITGDVIRLNTIGLINPSNGDLFFDPNESALVTEKLCVVSCTASKVSEHVFSWGCDNKSCQNFSIGGFVRVGEGQPKLQANPVGVMPNDQVGYCQEGSTVLSFRNAGVEVDFGFGAMLNLEPRLGLQDFLSLKAGGFEINRIQIGDVIINNPDTTLIDLSSNPLFLTDPDGPGGIDDVDGDGYFDDLPIDASFELRVFYDFDCTTAQSSFNLGFNNRDIVFNADLKYENSCKENLIDDFPFFNGVSNVKDTYENCIDPDGNADGEPFFIEHIHERQVSNFEKNCDLREEFQVVMVLPKGIVFDPNVSTLRVNNGTQSLNIVRNELRGDSLIVGFDGSSESLAGKFNIKLGFRANCDANPGLSNFPFAFGHYCPPCDCRHIWFYDTLLGPRIHVLSPPCPIGQTCPKGIRGVDFNVERTTFGFADRAYTIPFSPSNANKGVAISCDSVRMSILNVVGDSPISDSIGMYITYENIDTSGSTAEIFTFGGGHVRITHGGQVYSCKVDSTMLTKFYFGDSKKLKFDLDSCLRKLGITLMPGDSVNFIGSFTVNPDGPYPDKFKKIPRLRGWGFATIDGQEYSCDDYGATFIVAKNKTGYATPGGSDFPKGCQQSPLQYRLLTVNNGFRDYFGDEFRGAIGVDSIVFNYDPTLVNSFEALKFEVSIPGHPINGNLFYEIPGFALTDNGHYIARFDTLSRVPSLNDVQSYAFLLKISLRPNCKSLTSSSLGNNLYRMDSKIYYVDRYYARNIGDGSCSKNVLESKPQTLTYSKPPELEISTLTNPNLLITGDTASWTIRQCNVSTEADAGLSWLGIDFNDSELEILGAQDVTTNSKITDLNFDSNNGSGRIFAITNPLFKALPGASPDDICNNIKIRAKVKKCGLSRLRIATGWNCGPFEDPNWIPDFYRPCEPDSLNSLSVETLDPSIEAKIINQPTTFESICDTISLDILLRNTGRGKTFDLISEFTVPLTGAKFLADEVEVAYPPSAAFVKTKTAPIFVDRGPRGSRYRFENFAPLNDYLNTNGLPGFNPLRPSDTNEMVIRYKFITDCDFVSGDLSYYSFVGKKLCGNPTNQDLGESLPISINGLTSPPDKEFDIEITPRSTIFSGGTGELEITLTNLKDTPTSNQDKVTIKLPQGILYVAGSSIGINPSSYIPGEPEIRIAGGLQLLTWAMPNGLTINQNGTIRFSVQAPNIAGCGTRTLEASITTVFRKSIFCSAGSQSCEVDIITTKEGEKFVDIPIGKDGNFAGDNKSICSGGSTQLDASSINAVTYEWSPSIGLSSTTIANPIANPNSTTIYTVLAVDQNGCINQDRVVVGVTSGIDVVVEKTDADCIGNVGSIRLIPSVQGNYTYTWSPNVSNTSEANNLGSGIYYFTVSDGACSWNGSSEIKTSGNLEVNISKTDATCTDSLGSYSLQIIGGQSPFSIEINGQRPFVIAANNLTRRARPASYNFVITDLNGCRASNNIQIGLSGGNVSDCPELFQDTCLKSRDTLVTICLPIPFAMKDSFDLEIDGIPYVGPLDPCDYDSIALYCFTPIFAISEFGPWKIDYFDFKGVKYSGMFTKPSELLNFIADKDPDSDWMMDSINQTIFGGTSYFSDYGNLKITNPQTWVSTTIFPSRISEALGTQITLILDLGEHDLVAIDHNNPCCRDTLCIEVEDLCPDIFDTDSLFTNFDSTIVCLPFDSVDLNNHSVTLNGIQYFGPFEGCDFDSTLIYCYAPIPAQGTEGPYEITQWATPSGVKTFSVQTMDELVTKMNQFDPNGNWVIDRTILSIVGGSLNTNAYGPMRIMQKSTWINATINPTLRLEANGIGIKVKAGTLLVIENKTTNCKDSLLIIKLNPNCRNTVNAKNVDLTINDCSKLAPLCIEELPFRLRNNYSLWENGKLYNENMTDCTSGGTAYYFPIGNYLLEWLDTETGCKDTLFLTVSCITPKVEKVVLTENEVISIELNDGDLKAISKVRFEGGNASIANMKLNGTLAEFTGMSKGYSETLFVLENDKGQSDSIRVEITIIERESAPKAMDDRGETIKNVSIEINVMTNDAFGSKYNSLDIVSNPSHGTVSVLPNGNLLYVPFNDYCDAKTFDQFEYKICNSGGCDQATVLVKITCDGIFIFNGFSPNGDGINDKFFIQGLDGKGNALTIYNRWGNMVYFHPEYDNSWDGTWEGAHLPSGIYFYFLKDSQGKSWSGNLTIQR